MNSNPDKPPSPSGGSRLTKIFNSGNQNAKSPTGVYGLAKSDWRVSLGFYSGSVNPHTPPQPVGLTALCLLWFFFLVSPTNDRSCAMFFLAMGTSAKSTGPSLNSTVNSRKNYT